MRCVARSTIQFGVISIPVKVFLSVVSERTSFRWITPEGNPVVQKLFDTKTGLEVKRQDVQNGIEVEKDKFIPISKTELKAIASEKQNIIELKEATSDILLPHQIDRTYYLVPDKSDQAYCLLYTVLVEAKQMVIGKWYMRGKDHLVSVLPTTTYLSLVQLHYPTSLYDLKLRLQKEYAPSKSEIDLALKLVYNLAKNGASNELYMDEYEARIKKLVEAKRTTAQGSLVERLRASVKPAKALKKRP